MIDRERVVRRHEIRRTAADAMNPLTVGNGELAFTADITGLQTFPGFHDPAAATARGGEAMPLGTQSQWGFHEMPNPEGFSLADVAAPYASPHGDVDYPVRYDLRKEREDLTDEEQAGYWLWVNPQRLDLGRIGLELRETPDAEPIDDIALLTDVEQSLDLWTGVLHSRFRWAGEDFRVTTACHGEDDVLAVRVESEALRDGRATLRIHFPYASDTFGGTAVWDQPDRHTTTVSATPAGARFDRRLDADGYTVDAGFSPAAVLEDLGDHVYRLRTDQASLELVAAFAPERTGRTLPDVDAVLHSSRTMWRAFWTGGAAVDLEGSTDARAAELERRIVLSQYITRTQCAGSMPSAETGLVQNSWAGKFNLEMHWWHAAHFAMWGRPELLERSFAWYLDALPVAQEIAARQGYRGARWPKHVGPEGRESPNDIGPLLIWQQPHPIHIAELLRRANPSTQEEIVARYAEIVEESAVFMASFLSRQPDGLYHLAPPIMPAQEHYDPRTVWDPSFELAYFWWGLETAQQWREHSGRPRRPEWDEILGSFAALPVDADGAYAAVGNPPRSVLTDHPSMLSALGVVPATPLVDAETVLRTLDHVVADWEWDTAWGWDFPVMAMAATRAGRPDLAVDALLMDSPRNRYLANGHNCQDPSRLPLYVPGNGGVLAAVALMAAGWDGATTASPGFPADGTWQVAFEGFAERP